MRHLRTYESIHANQKFVNLSDRMHRDIGDICIELADEGLDVDIRKSGLKGVSEFTEILIRYRKTDKVNKEKIDMILLAINDYLSDSNYTTLVKEHTSAIFVNYYIRFVDR